MFLTSTFRSWHSTLKTTWPFSKACTYMWKAALYRCKAAYLILCSPFPLILYRTFKTLSVVHQSHHRVTNITNMLHVVYLISYDNNIYYYIRSNLISYDNYNTIIYDLILFHTTIIILSYTISDTATDTYS